LALTNPGGQNLTISPTQIDTTLSPGGVGDGDITVINDGADAYDYTVYATPYHVSGEGYTRSFSASPTTGDVSAWLTLPKGLQHLDPHGTGKVPYSLRVPAGAGGGGYYGAIFVEMQPRPVVGSGVVTKQRVGVIVYLRVDGGVKESGRLASFMMDFWQFEAPVKAQARMSNDGNVHFKAKISEHIDDLFGTTKASIALEREILPGTTRRLDLIWDHPPDLGLFWVNGTATFLNRTEALGGHSLLVISTRAAVALGLIMLVLLISIVWWARGRRAARTNQAPPRA
jgi:hypothetical protein